MVQPLIEFVRRRAHDRCEYCRLPQFAYPVAFELDHIVAIQHGGATEAENLAWCCPGCNRHKGPNIAGLDEVTGQIVPLYNPRLNAWAEHFELRGATLVGRTPAGRATAAVLKFNHPPRLALREALIAEGAYTP